MLHQTKETTIENLKQFFSQTTEDYVLVRDAWAAWGREVTPEKEDQNKNWFSNKLTMLKYHGLVKPVYTIKRTDKGARRLLSKIELTMEGKKALGRLAAPLPLRPGTVPPLGTPDAPFGMTRPADHYDAQSMSIPEVMKVVAKLRKDHPEFEIVFDIRLRDNAVSSGTE